jgi:hypothetical protein
VRVVPKLECECDPTGTGPHLIGCPLFVQGKYATADLIDAIHGLDEYRAALVQAEEALSRAQTYIGLLRQYDPELSMLVAAARERANKALATPQQARESE